MIPRNEVSKLIGKPFVAIRDGYAWGCLAPMYEILPETLKFRYPASEDRNMLQYFKEHCKELSMEDKFQYGDILVLKLPKNQWHLMVYLDGGKAIHCTGHIETEIVFWEKYKGRVKGVFRVV